MVSICGGGLFFNGFGLFIKWAEKTTSSGALRAVKIISEGYNIGFLKGSKRIYLTFINGMI